MLNVCKVKVDKLKHPVDFFVIAIASLVQIDRLEVEKIVLGIKKENAAVMTFQFLVIERSIILIGCNRRYVQLSTSTTLHHHYHHLNATAFFLLHLRLEWMDG